MLINTLSKIILHENIVIVSIIDGDVQTEFFWCADLINFHQAQKKQVKIKEKSMQSEFLMGLSLQPETIIAAYIESELSWFVAFHWLFLVA